MGDKGFENLFSETNEEFRKIITDLKSKKLWLSYRTEVVTQDGPEKYYLMFVDNKAYLINEKLDIKTTSLSNMRIYNSDTSSRLFFLYVSYDFPTFYISISKKNNIEKYQEILPSYESIYLQWINQWKDKLLSDSYVRTLLLNFLDIYSKNFYSKLDNAYYLEDDLLTEVFPRPKKYNYTIVQEVRETLEEDFQKLIDLLCKRNYFPREKMLEDEHSYFLVINKALQKTALTFYSNLFEKSYGGYFTSIDEITLDNCIRSYFKIDFLDKTDNTIISLLTYYLFSR